MALCSAVPTVVAARDLVDAPVVWYEDDRHDIAPPRPRRPNLAKEIVTKSFTSPIRRATYPPRLIRGVGSWFGGDHVPAAVNVNRLGEVPNSSWFTNRIGLFRLSAQQVAAGASSNVSGPDRSRPWTIISAKTEGFSPGFNIRDAKGNVYLIKFDPAGYPNSASAAGVISGRILDAAGYNVPGDAVVYFRRQDLVVGEAVMIRIRDEHERPMNQIDLNALGRRKKRPMVAADVDQLLQKVHRRDNGEYRAIASRYLDGQPLGPFEYEGKRRDDPNDRVRHENRRELRGLRIFAAWLSHYDTKQHNTLDMYVEENGSRFVRHFLIDFASTLGAGALGPGARYSHEYNVSVLAVSRRLITLGFYEDTWRKIRRPDGLEEVGYFSSRYFDPLRFRPLITNPAFSNLTDQDAYWAAKIISAFTDEHLRAIVEQGQYDDPRAADYVAGVLIERRDILVRRFFDRIAPLDFFVLRGNLLRYHDLGVERGIYPSAGNTRYRARFAACDRKRRTQSWTAWAESSAPQVDLASAATTPERAFVAVQCAVNRGSGWSEPVTAYVALASRRIVAVHR